VKVAEKENLVLKSILMHVSMGAQRLKKRCLYMAETDLSQRATFASLQMHPGNMESASKEMVFGPASS